MKTLFTPIVYNSLSIFRDSPPTARLVVATSYHTVYPIYSAYRDKEDVRLAYYIQDYEAWFEESARKAALLTYSLIENKFTISTWLHDKLLTEHGQESALIPLGVDRTIFYPRHQKPGRNARRIAAMVRTEPRRGMDNLFKALQILSSRRRIKVDLFGPA